MDAYDAIITKLDIWGFGGKHVPADVKKKVLEAARATGSGMNSQHWRFILIQDRSNLQRLADDSTTGRWVSGADFAVIILTTTKWPTISAIDAGRVLQDMQVAAWNFGVGSRIFTGIKTKELVSDFRVPQDLQVSAVVGFGYPMRKVKGKKTRLPLDELVYLERYGNKYRLEELK